MIITLSDLSLAKLLKFCHLLPPSAEVQVGRVSAADMYNAVRRSTPKGQQETVIKITSGRMSSVEALKKKKEEMIRRSSAGSSFCFSVRRRV